MLTRFTDYSVRCDKTRHCVLKVGISYSATEFISRDGKKIDLRKLPTAAFEKQYGLVYQDYPLNEFAQRLLNAAQYGVIVTSRASAHLLNLIYNKEPSMAKTSAPIPAAVVQIPAATSAKTEKVEKVVKAPKAETKTKTEGVEGERAPRNRREKLAADAKIKVLAANPARTGTMRHEIVETIFQAKTVAMALDSSVTRKDGSDYKVGLPDLYFALENGLIELV